jgi:hypothetical protein
MYLLGFLVIFLSGCVSFTTGQTAQTLKPGKGGGMVVATYSRYMSQATVESTPSSTTTTSGDDQHSVSFESGYRYGLIKNLEVVAIGGLGASRVGGKYRVVGSKALAVAFGLEFSYFFSQQKNPGNESRSAQEIIYVPVYISTDLSPSLSLYFVPRYAYIHGSNDDSDSGVTSAAQGASLGAIFGANIGFLAEISAFEVKNADSKSTFTQLVAGLVFGRKNLDR